MADELTNLLQKAAELDDVLQELRIDIDHDSSIVESIQPIRPDAVVWPFFGILLGGLIFTIGIRSDEFQLGLLLGPIIAACTFWMSYSDWARPRQAAKKRLEVNKTQLSKLEKLLAQHRLEIESRETQEKIKQEEIASPLLQLLAEKLNIAKLLNELDQRINAPFPPQDFVWDIPESRQSCSLAVNVWEFYSAVANVDALEVVRRSYAPFGIDLEKFIQAVNPPDVPKYTHTIPSIDQMLKDRKNTLDHFLGDWINESGIDERRAHQFIEEFKTENEFFEAIIDHNDDNKKLLNRLRNARGLRSKMLKDHINSEKARVERIWIENNHEWCKSVFDTSKSIEPDQLNAFFSTCMNCLFLSPPWAKTVFDFNYEPESQILVADLKLPDLSGPINTITPKGDTKLANKTERASFIKEFTHLFTIAFGLLAARLAENTAVQLICINGYRDYIDPGTGLEKTDYALSLSFEPEDLLIINLEKVDPIACFKKLKGITLVDHIDVVPIQPIITFDKTKNKFVEGKDVIREQEGMNLAAMDWQDFEHLVRELFAKEYNAEDQEVKVTQSSRDQGIDAVIFDPDPIKGGKIIVQAKRYTNVVDVSYVRDLYGTLMNEGAMKGILITTSTFGKESVEFAKDKPLTLINGAQLLFLLQKHGHKARIDIAEAKKILKEKEAS